jgi:hypothetical protein
MATQETRTTQLEAINSMLACVGEAPVNSITGNLTANVQIAVDLLRTTSRKVQTTGYNFNTEDDFELSLDTDSKIPLPGNALEVDITLEDGTIDPIMMGDFLYDKKAHSFTFTRSVKCTIKFFRAWEEMPESARNYIKVKAARIYQDQTVGSQEHHQFSLQDETEAYATFITADGENEDANIFDTFFMGSIVNRKRPLITQF